MGRQPKPGDYVLATKYRDGDPKDHWAVGFYESKLDDRYMVMDNNGVSFRPNGFRRIQNISKEQGEWLLKNSQQIELGGKSLWALVSRR